MRHRPRAAPAVDPTVLQSLAARLGERGPAMLARLLDTWEGETARRLSELRAAVEEQDADAVAGVAHAIRGSSASLGAARLAEVCGEVEMQIRAGQAVDLAAAEGAIHAGVATARAGLAQLRVGSGG